MKAFVLEESPGLDDESFTEQFAPLGGSAASGGRVPASGKSALEPRLQLPMAYKHAVHRTCLGLAAVSAQGREEIAAGGGRLAKDANTQCRMPNKTLPWTQVQPGAIRDIRRISYMETRDYLEIKNK